MFNVTAGASYFRLFQATRGRTQANKYKSCIHQRASVCNAFGVMSAGTNGTSTKCTFRASQSGLSSSSFHARERGNSHPIGNCIHRASDISATSCVLARSERKKLSRVSLCPDIVFPAIKKSKRIERILIGIRPRRVHIARGVSRTFPRIRGIFPTRITSGRDIFYEGNTDATHKRRPIC